MKSRAGRTRELARAPESARDRELWLQHVAGFVLLRDVRGYALGRLETRQLSPEARAAAERAIDDALYGVMMVADGVVGDARGNEQLVEVEVVVEYSNRATGESESLCLSKGDGVCMAYHGWLEGDFGSDLIHDS